MRFKKKRFLSFKKIVLTKQKKNRHNRPAKHADEAMKLTTHSCLKSQKTIFEAKKKRWQDKLKEISKIYIYLFIPFTLKLRVYAGFIFFGSDEDSGCDKIGVS